MAPAFVRHCAGHLTNPILSPALSPDDGHWKRLQDAGVAVHIDCGTSEVLYDDGCMLVKGMRAQGLDVQFREVSTPQLTCNVPELTSVGARSALRVRAQLPPAQAVPRRRLFVAPHPRRPRRDGGKGARAERVRAAQLKWCGQK